VYAYFEADEVARANLAFFLTSAVSKDGRGNVEYVIVVNGRVITVAVPELPHVRVVMRDNTCYDSGAYAHVLNTLAPKELAAFDFFIFINSSVRGPFLPLYPGKIPSLPRTK
jgi:lipopolysaccharide biosynthesis protein